MLSILALIGIMSAMNEEASTLLENMNHKEEIHIGCRKFIKGKFDGMDVVFALSGIGKVAAATTATLMVSHFDVEGIVFTGIAGGGGETDIGDVVIGHSYVQHDLDTRPIFPICYIHSLNSQVLKADEKLYTRAKRATENFLTSGVLKFTDKKPKLWEGVIVSGDQFVISQSHHQEIVERTKEVIPQGFHAIEMEGAAVAQVCTEFNTPFVVLRAISDRADHSAPIDFLQFCKIASHYTLGILKEFAKLSHHSND